MSLINKLIATQQSRARKDIRSWRSAMLMAENVKRPRRSYLYSIYNEMTLDAHLYAEMQKRVLAVRGCEFGIHRKGESTDTKVTDLFQKPWFLNFIDLALESIFYGHSLIEIDGFKDGEIKGVSLVKRSHVVPEKGLFLVRQNDEKGINYRTDKRYSDWLLEVGKHNDLGLFNKCVPHVLYKRFAQSAWSEYCEVFGMPLRIGKTNSKDTESLNRMENMMVNMGAASYGIIDENEEIEFIQASGGKGANKGAVYSSLIDKCNSELSKLMNGAVIGADTEGGSRSKEEVGERISELITKADKTYLQSFINIHLFPKLISFGYPLDGYKFRFEISKDIDELWDITKGVLKHYEVKPEFIMQTFGIPVKSRRN